MYYRSHNDPDYGQPPLTSGGYVAAPGKAWLFQPVSGLLQAVTFAYMRVRRKLCHLAGTVLLVPVLQRVSLGA